MESPYRLSSCRARRTHQEFCGCLDAVPVAIECARHHGQRRRGICELPHRWPGVHVGGERCVQYARAHLLPDHSANMVCQTAIRGAGPPNRTLKLSLTPYILAVGGTVRPNSSTELAMRHVLNALQRGG